MRFSVKVDDFRRLIHNISLFASTDDTLPTITAIDLEWDGDTLTACATDRYQAARSSVPIVEAETQPGGVLVNAKELLWLLKQMPRAENAFQLTVSVTLNEFEIPYITLNTISGSQLRIQALIGRMPKTITKQIDGADFETGSIGNIAINPRLLATWSKLLDYNGKKLGTTSHTVKMWFDTPSKPIRWRVAEVEGVTMPIRVDGFPEWNPSKSDADIPVPVAA